MTNKLYSALVAVAGGAALVGAPASQAGMPDGLDVSTKFSQQFQDVDAEFNDNAGVQPAGGLDQEYSFEFPRVALDINAQFTPWLSMYAEFTNEVDDNGDGFAANDVANDLTLINVDVLKAAGSAAADNNSLTLQFGTPVGGLSNYFNGTDGALAQTNPLIGNAPFRPIDAMTGIKLIGSHDIGGVVKSVSWDAGFYTGNFFPGADIQSATSGSSNAAGDSGNGGRDEDRGESFNLRGKLTFAGGFSAGAGFVDAEDNAQFFDSSNDVFNVGGTFETNANVFGSANPVTGGAIGPNFTSEAQGWNLEAQWKAPEGMMLEGSKILGKYTEVEGNGLGQDDDSQELESWKILGQAYVVPDTAYLAARWQTVTNESDGVSSNDELERFQIGGGVWLADNTLLKAEYFDQSEEANMASAVGGNRATDFDGFGLELSSSF